MSASPIDRARSALHALDPGCSRDEWAVLGMAAKDAGLTVNDFIAWSEAAGNFGGDADCRAAWRSFKPGKVTQATLFAKALDAGWTDPDREDRRPQQKRQEASKAPGKGERPTVDFRAVWEAAEAASEAHPYIARKLGLPFGLRVYRGSLSVGGQALDGALLVPVHDAEGRLQSWQAIPPQGKKVNAPGAPIKGGSLVVGGPVRDDDQVLVCEGISAAWSAHQASRKPAVVCFGAGNVESVARQLHERHPGARITIVCDGGKEALGERVAQAVGGAWVEMPEGSPANFDLNDVHAEDGLGAVAELLGEVRTPQPEPGSAPPEYADFRTLDSNPPPARQWAIEDWLPLGSVTALFGGGGIGKSLLAQQMQTHVANGVPIFGKSVRMGPVLGFHCEDDNDELRRRQRAILARMGRSPAYSADGLHIAGRAGLDNCILTFGRDRLPVPTALHDLIERECARIRPALLVLDNVAQLFAGSENDRFEVTTFCNVLAGIANRHGCAVLLLGHIAKSEGSEFSGSTAWEAAVRTRLWLERRGDGLIELHRRKANYAGRDSVVLEYQHGALAEINPAADGAAESLLLAQAERDVLDALDRLTARQVATSQAPSATTYLPRLAHKEGLLGSTTKENAGRALSALIDCGEILVGQSLGWKKSDRHEAIGLARKGDEGDEGVRTGAEGDE